MAGWWDDPFVRYYECEDVLSSILTKDDQQVTSVQGDHIPGRSNDQVVSFYAFRTTIKFFPRGLENFFKNIEYIGIVNVQLQEIHQEDLKAFPKLRVLYLDTNQIQFLTPNLFEFNKNLEVVNLNDNRIQFVDHSVFKNLYRLKYLWFEFNSCYSVRVNNDIKAVQVAVSHINQNCFVNNVIADIRSNQKEGMAKLGAEIERLKGENERLRSEIMELRFKEGKCEVWKENLDKCEKELESFKNLQFSKIKCEC